ncbi:MAG: hypothetical protein H6577_23565 [Lewinellaceae bacterium]|nr:hypothetical protein [Saprospiraceae bacterium]MCB9341116.1 hypothetical protein [Lewinellaceae bacterium]
MKKHFTTWLIAGLFLHLAHSQTLYVKDGATGDGYSWESPLGNLQKALRIAAPGAQIWVAQGNYLPVDCIECSPLERAIAFEIPASVRLYGGFKGTESSLEERDWKSNPTILSGNIGRADCYDNSQTVVRFENVPETTVLDGFFILNGHAEQEGRPGNPCRSGAGVFNHCSNKGGRSNPLIQHCIFMDNYAWEGAAIFNFSEKGNAGATIKNCFFVKNESKLAGGAVLDNIVAGTGHSSIYSCRFVNNTAAFGGAYFCNGASAGVEVFSNCTFINNRSGFGGAAFLLTGGEKLDQWGLGCIFKDNHAREGNDFFFQEGFQLPASLEGLTETKGL